MVCQKAVALMNQSLEQRIEELESKIAFKEHSIEQMSDEMAQQQKLVAEMTVQIRYLAGKVKSLQSANMDDPTNEPPPPHY